MAERDPVRIVEIYADAMRLTQERVAPLVEVLDQAAAADADLRAYRAELVERRAHCAGMIARHIADVGGLRPGVAAQEAADTIFAMNSAERFMMLTRDRGWPPERFGRWLAEAGRASCSTARNGPRVDAAVAPGTDDGPLNDGGPVTAIR